MAVQSINGQAMLALEKGMHPKAKQLFEESLATVPHDAASRRLPALVGLGRAALALGEIGRCRQCFCEALRIAIPTGFLPHALSALMGTASLLAEEASAGRAVELLALVLRHPAAYHADKARAQSAAPVAQAVWSQHIRAYHSASPGWWAQAAVSAD